MSLVYGIRLNARPPNKHDAMRPLPPELQVRHEPTKEEKHLIYERHKAAGKIDGRAKNLNKIRDLDFYYAITRGVVGGFPTVHEKIEKVVYTIEKKRGAVWVPVLTVWGISTALLFKNSLVRYGTGKYRVR